MKRYAMMFLCAAVLLLSLTGCGKKTDALIAQPDNLYVADEADVLSAETEDYVVTRVNALKDACGGEIAVVTIDYLNDLTAEEFCYRLFNQWQIGDKSKNNGMLVLLVIGENSCWLTPGYGLEDDFPSTQCTEYLGTYLWQYQNAGDCDTGVGKLIDALVAWYGSYYGVTVAGTQSDLIYDFSVNTGYGTPYPGSPSQSSEGSGGISIWVLLAIGFVIFLLLQKGDKKTGYRRQRSYFVPLVVASSILNHTANSSHSSAGSSHFTHMGGSTGGSHSTHFGGGGTHGGGGGFHG